MEQKLNAAKEKLDITMVDIENIKTERNHIRKAIEEKRSGTSRIVSQAEYCQNKCSVC